MDFLDFNVFLIFWVESKKNRGNVWILLMSLVKIIIFSSFFEFCNEIQNNLENTMISTSDTNKHQTFPREFLDFTTKSTNKNLENIMIDTSTMQTFPMDFFGFYPKNQKTLKSKK